MEIENPSVTNIFKQPDTSLLPLMMNGMGNSGAGVGLGGIGGFVAGALLGGRNGIFGGNGDNGGSAVNQLTLSQIQSDIGDIKASVPLAEAQVQLALAGSTSDINQLANSNTMALMNQGTQSMLASVQGFANTGDKIDGLATTMATGMGIIGQAIDRGTFALSQVVTNDGDKTRALITNYETANANRRETILANELSDLRAAAARAADAHGISIQMTNQQNQNQLQFQQQAQAINTVAHLLSDVSQIARATNQSLIIGNTGAVLAGSQTANPTNVRA